MVQLSGDSSLRIDISFLEFLDLLHSSSSSRAGTDNSSSTIDQHNQIIPYETPLSTSRNRKAVTSVQWLQLALVACYLAHGLVKALFTHSRQSLLIFFVRQLTGTLVNLHSSPNSISFSLRVTHTPDRALLWILHTLLRGFILPRDH